jgi:DNA-binding CsgD family transcriptional regulator
MFLSSEFLELARSHLERCRSLPQVESVLRELAREVGMKHVFYGREGHVNPIILGSYPREWIEHYIQNGYRLIDPAVSLPSRSVIPADWQLFHRTSPEVRRIFAEAAEAGVGMQGVTIPIRGHAGETAVCSFTSDLSRCDWDALMVERISALHLFAFLVHQRVLELTSTRAPKLLKLSPRELDCLKYCAGGLTDPEIARKLGISRYVVSGYLESARHKLSAPTRTNAVATAIKLQIIPLEALK